MRKPTPHEKAIFDAVVEVARPVILTEFRPDSCIASVRIGLDVLAYFGIAAREYPVLIALFNKEAADLVRSGMPMEQVGEETRKHAPASEGGPWSMAVGAPTGRPEGWAGHLVVGHPATGMVMDLSADQANRPHKGIVLEPFWFQIPAEQWWIDPTQSYGISNGDGLILIYDRRCPDPTGYLGSKNWKRMTGGNADKGVYKRLTGQIIREVKARLD